MKKIILIYLPHPYLKQPEAQAPMGLLALASVLLTNNIEVDVKNYTSLSVEEAIKELPEASIYGITVTSLELLAANRFAKVIKDKYPNSKVILGGPGTYSDEFVDWSVIDSILKGEGDITILDIIKDYDNNKFKKIYIGKIVKNLNKLPFPARQLLKNGQGGNIFAFNKQYKQGGSTIILSSRGCPFNCSFCSAPSFTYNRQMRFRSAENIYNEIKQVIKRYNIRQFRFSDDMFTTNKKHVLSICKLLEKLDIVWRISCRVNPFDYDMFKAMYDSGCKELSFGIESFDDNVLKLLNKKATAKDNVKALELSHKIGFKTRILFMIRTPGQTKDTVKINIKYLKQVPYTIIACTSFCPLPGSKIWSNPDKFNIKVLNKNLDDYNFYMYGSSGKNELKNIIKIKDRSLKEFNEESEYFRDWIENTGKTNRG